MKSLRSTFDRDWDAGAARKSAKHSQIHGFYDGLLQTIATTLEPLSKEIADALKRRDIEPHTYVSDLRFEHYGETSSPDVRVTAVGPLLPAWSLKRRHIPAVQEKALGVTVQDIKDLGRTDGIWLASDGSLWNQRPLHPRTPKTRLQWHVPNGLFQSRNGLGTAVRIDFKAAVSRSVAWSIQNGFTPYAASADLALASSYEERVSGSNDVVEVGSDPTRNWRYTSQSGLMAYPPERGVWKALPIQSIVEDLNNLTWWRT